jgi:hypothetical protein
VLEIKILQSVDERKNCAVLYPSLDITKNPEFQQYHTFESKIQSLIILVAVAVYVEKLRNLESRGHFLRFSRQIIDCFRGTMDSFF